MSTNDEPCVLCGVNHHAPGAKKCKVLSVRDVTKRHAASKPCPHPGTYHLGSDGLAVIRPHPQANSCFAREQGYVILKIEPWAREAGPAIVAAMNAADVKVQP